MENFDVDTKDRESRESTERTPEVPGRAPDPTTTPERTTRTADPDFIRRVGEGDKDTTTGKPPR
jgi:hypothetical protein